MGPSPKPGDTGMGGSELRDHIAGTYFGLRMALAVVGFSLPVVLIVAGLILETDQGLRPSLSDYYNSPGRDVFVGALIAIGAILVAYRGFSPAEDRALDLAGVFAVVTALVPTGATMHGVAAVALFLCVAYVCWFRARDTLSLVEDEELRRRYETTYKALGALMAILPATAAVLSHVLLPSIVVLVVEVIAVLVFGVYWMAKSREYARTHAEERAAAGRLAVAPAGGAGMEAAPPSPAGRLARLVGRPFDDRRVVELPTTTP